ncbi:MAG: amidohydrolase family protein [Nitrososphaerota archaeon]|jgi:cytosine deaminase|nr:amidohydrolase family protein [Nitrososphaerota archaeon]
MDLVVRNAILLGREDPVDISVSAGMITSVRPRVQARADVEIDADHKLVLPTFIEPHVHLDKAFLAEKLPEAESMSEARRRVRDAKAAFTEDDVFRRAERCIREALLHGVTAIRTHVDVDSMAGLRSFRALTRLKAMYSKTIKIQLVAFPQEGFSRDKEAFGLLEKAIELGAGAVGGLPETEGSLSEGIRHLENVTRLAEEHNLPLDVHCDVQPYTSFIEHYAKLVKKVGLRGRATADHIIALSYYDDSLANSIIRELKSSNMNVITNPCTMMVGGSQDPPPRGRGITRVKEIMRAGVNIAYGLDNVVDPYNPFGEFHPLKNGWLLAYEAQLNREADFEAILRMPTYNSALILGLKGYGIEPGCSADFNVLSESTPREALRKGATANVVVKDGRILSQVQS